MSQTGASSKGEFLEVHVDLHLQLLPLCHIRVSFVKLLSWYKS